MASLLQRTVPGAADDRAYRDDAQWPVSSSSRSSSRSGSTDGGRGLGTTMTSVRFLVSILAIVVFLTITRRDRIEGSDDELVRPPA
jgi:hypothetical protein